MKNLILQKPTRHLLNYQQILLFMQGGTIKFENLLLQIDYSLVVQVFIRIELIKLINRLNLRHGHFQNKF